MAAFGAVNLAAALLLFTGGVLLGLYFDLPAAGGPARASLGAEAEAAVEKALADRTGGKPAAAPPGSGGSAEPSGAAEPSGERSPPGSSPADPAGADPAGGAAPPEAAVPPEAAAPPAGESRPGAAAPQPAPEPAEPAPALVPAPPPPPAPAAQPVLAVARENAPAAPPARAAAPAAAGTAFAVQIGAYSVEDNALREISSLEAAGYQPYVVTVTGSAGRPLHTVLLGAWGDRREADSEAARFATRQGRKVWVRPVGPS